MAADDLDESGGIECPNLLEAIQTAAAAVVGPEGFPAAYNVPNGFEGEPFFFEKGGWFEPGADPSGDDLRVLPLDRPDALVVDGVLVVVRDGWLFVVGPDGEEPVGSVWLGAVPTGATAPLLIPDPRGVLVVAETPLSREGAEPETGVRLTVVSLDEPGNPRVLEAMEVTGLLAGLETGDGRHRLAIRRSAPALDFVTATTPGGRDAATDSNRGVVMATTIRDWVARSTFTAGDGTERSGFLGGCEVTTSPGSESALGMTTLMHLVPGESLADVEAHTVLGEGAVLFDGELAYLLSPRNSVVGFDAGDRDTGRGVERVVITRLRSGSEGYQVEAAGIVGGMLSAPTAVGLDDEGVLVFTVEPFDDSLTLTSLGGESELRPLDSHDLPLNWWGVTVTRWHGPKLVLSRGGGVAVVDTSDRSDLDIRTAETLWDRGNRVVLDDITPFGESHVLAIGRGPVMSDRGLIESFLKAFAQGPGERQPGPVGIALRTGDPFDGETTAAWSGEALGLWPVGVDPTTGTATFGVLGLLDPEDPIPDAGSFTGAISFRRVGEELVEQSRVALTRVAPDNVGATDCEHADMDQLIGNAQFFTCEPGVGAGVVGYWCRSAGLSEIGTLLERQVADNVFEDDLDAFRGVVAGGGTVVLCIPEQFGGPDVPVGRFDAEDGGGHWLTTPTGVVWVDGSGEAAEVVPLEPPYGG